LPYNAASASKTVAVTGISLKNMTVTPGPPWTAGQTVTLKVTVYEDTTPKAGYYVYFYIHTHYDDVVKSYGPFASDSTGTVSWSWTIPWTQDGYPVPCSYIRFYAYDPASMASSNQVIGDCAYPTRLSISAPDKVTVGMPFTVSGKLEYQSSSTAWTGLGGRTVSIYYDGNKLADAKTGTDGSYSVSVSIPKTGTYTLKASYAGEGFGTAPAVAGTPVAAVLGEGASTLVAAVPFALLALAVAREHGWLRI
jgi:hypothetical protein